MAQQPVTTGGYALRILAAVLLVLLTFNPSGYSYVHWFVGQFPHLKALTALVGVLLLICWVVYVGATVKSLRLIGMVLLIALFAALAWVAASVGALNLSRGATLQWVMLLAAGVILGIGMCWSHWHRRLTGQTDVDELEPR